jgi:heme-degrading monooxygenase HmoA
MGNPPLAEKGNFIHIYDFRVKPGTSKEFIKRFTEFDQAADNPMHHSSAQVKDGVLCQDENDQDHFYLLAEWRDKEEHRRIRKWLVENMRPAFLDLVVDLDKGSYIPVYADVVL